MMPMVARVAATGRRAGMHVCADRKQNGRDATDQPRGLSARAAVFPQLNKLLTMNPVRNK